MSQLALKNLSKSFGSFKVFDNLNLDLMYALPGQTLASADRAPARPSCCG